MGNFDGKGGKKSINCIIVNDELITDEKKIAQSFNKYFSNVAKNLDDEIPIISNTEENGNLHAHNHSLFLFPVSIEECKKHISSLNDTYYGINSIYTDKNS